MPGESILRFLAFAAFVVAVAIGLRLAGVDGILVVLGIGHAWAIASLYEWLAQREPDGARLPFERPSSPLNGGTRLSERRKPQKWNLWNVEQLARAESRREPSRAGEWSQLFLNLRQFAEPGGTLPTEFDGLVRGSFGSLLERLER